MWFFEFFQLFFFIGLLICCIPLLGSYMAQVFEGKRTFLHPVLGGLEKVSYKISGVDPEEEMGWLTYLKVLLLFNLFGFIAVFILLLTQQFQPFNPQQFPGVSWPLAFNIAASFVTNTDWQTYPVETTISYTTHLLGMTVQNFLSASTGMCALLVLIRGIKRKQKDTIGNVWADIVRTIVYLLLPLALILSIVLVSQGVIQSFSPYVDLTTVEGIHQTIPMGPVASQESIKQLGSNGGGFFKTNSAHPFENPTAISNFLELFAILLIPAATVYAYGLMVGSPSRARFLLFVMFFIWICGLILGEYAEHQVNPVMEAYPLLEGKETRIGICNSVLWAITTTATSNGSVNTMHSSLMPITGGVALFNIILGELIFGGVGVGLCSMLMFVLLTLFIVGLLVGRNPEYIGKKITRTDIQWATFAVLCPGAIILIGAGFASVFPETVYELKNNGPHGLMSIVYAFSSAAENNGSAYVGVGGNTTFYYITLGLVMLVGRLSIIISSIAIGGHLAAKKIFPVFPGLLVTSNFSFAFVLIGVILFMGFIVFFPILSLGPILEHLLMLRGWSF